MYQYKEHPTFNGEYGMLYFRGIFYVVPIQALSNLRCWNSQWSISAS